MVICFISITGCRSQTSNTVETIPNGSAGTVQQTAAEQLAEYDFTPTAKSDNQAVKEVNTYFTLPASRDASVRIPVGVTMPAMEKEKTCPVVILIHGFLGSKDEEFGFYANATDEKYDYESMADQLLKLGIGTIRIDQAGSGESKDDFRNYTLNNSVSDLQDAYDYCMENFSFNPEKVGLVGWSMGGKVGPKFAFQNDNISTRIALSIRAHMSGL